jgi:hypothetical protein
MWVSQQLGHRDLTTTLRYYGEFIPKKGETWADILEREILGPTPQRVKIMCYLQCPTCRLTAGVSRHRMPLSLAGAARAAARRMRCVYGSRVAAARGSAGGRQRDGAKQRGSGGGGR